MEQAKLIWKIKREKGHGNSMEMPKEKEKLTLEQTAQGIDEIIHKDSKLTEPVFASTCELARLSTVS